MSTTCTCPPACATGGPLSLGPGPGAVHAQADCPNPRHAAHARSVAEYRASHGYTRPRQERAGG